MFHPDIIKLVCPPEHNGAFHSPVGSCTIELQDSETVQQGIWLPVGIHPSGTVEGRHWTLKPLKAAFDEFHSCTCRYHTGKCRLRLGLRMTRSHNGSAADRPGFSVVRCSRFPDVFSLFRNRCRYNIWPCPKNVNHIVDAQRSTGFSLDCSAAATHLQGHSRRPDFKTCSVAKHPPTLWLKLLSDLN